MAGTTPATRRRLLGPLGRRDVDQRPQAEVVDGHDRAARTPPSVAPLALASGSSTGRTDGGRRRAATDGAPEVGQLGGVGQVADGHEVPHLLEAAVASEVDGIEPAVVELPGLAVDVADGGVGDGDAVEARGDVDQGAHDLDVDARGPLINVDPINVEGMHTMAR